MKANVRWVDDFTFISSGESGHYVVMDSDHEDRSPKANGPTELLLQSLCVCTGMDVISILRKMKEPVNRFEINATATRASEHPKVITEINLEYVVYGEINSENLEKAITLSQEKYCNISITLKRGGVKINISSRIINKII